jgi:hypothetical protein
MTLLPHIIIIIINGFNSWNETVRVEKLFAEDWGWGGFSSSRSPSIWMFA